MFFGVGGVGRLGVTKAGGKAGPSLDLSFMTPGTLDPRLTFTRASVGTYFDSGGVMQTAAINAPRWDYDPVTHVLRGLLLEIARTNLLLNSATLGTQSVAVTAQPYVLSFYGTGTITLSGVSTAGPLTGTGAFPQRVSLAFTPTAGTLTLTITGSVLNAQLEATPVAWGNVASSWISTAGTTVARSADQCTIQPANMGWFVPPGGSWAVELINLSPSVTSTHRIVGRPDVSGSPAAITLLPSGPPLGVGQFDGVGSVIAPGSSVVNATSKAATTWATGSAQACINAGTVTNSAALTSGYAAYATQGVFFMTSVANSAESVDGYLRRVRYWPRALSAAELQAATA
jgi:hypothetical protein